MRVLTPSGWAKHLELKGEYAVKKYYHVGHMISAVSEEEMERRWAAIQKGLKEAEVDCLLLYAMEARQGAPVKYTINWSCEDGQGYTIIVPKEGKGAVFGHGYYGTPTVPPECVKQIGFNVASPCAPVLGYTDEYIPRGIMEFLKMKSPVKRIGIYRRNIMPWHFIQHIRENLPDVEFVDCDELYDSVKAVKSGEELDALRDSSFMQDQLYDAMQVYVRPGRLEKEITVDLRKAALDMDCESLNIMIGSGRTVADLEYDMPMQMQNHRLEKGDMIKIILQCAMRGGYFANVGRMWSIGKPSAEYVKAVEDSFRLQDELAAMLKPGLMPAELCRAASKFRKENGYLEDGWLIGSAQGIDMVERPAFLDNETMPIGENMFFSIHAACKTGNVYANCYDNFIVTKDGAERITKTARKLFII
jgi:Xaa-Pro aminopeptidase